MTSSAVRRLPAEDPIEAVRTRDGRAEPTALPLASKLKKPFRALTGPVEMLGPQWAHERTAWQRQILRSSLGKLAIKIAIELSLDVDRTTGARNAGYAVRSHQWLAEQLGSSRIKVIEAVSSLENRGFIAVKRGARKGVPNRYALTFPPASLCWDFDDDAPPF